MPSKNTIPFDLPGFEVDQVDSYDDLLVIQAYSTAMEAICPSCDQSSDRVHSRYIRIGTKLKQLEHLARRDNSIAAKRHRTGWACFA
jgi:23S rRNA G2069 N7-methylase RlmK/C1962 C5-methylase RlmI